MYRNLLKGGTPTDLEPTLVSGYRGGAQVSKSGLLVSKNRFLVSENRLLVSEKMVVGGLGP